MKVTNEIVVDLNNFRNNMIMYMDTLPGENNKITDFIQIFKELKKDLDIELMNPELSEKRISNLMYEISTVCFLIYRKMEGK